MVRRDALPIYITLNKILPKISLKHRKNSQTTWRLFIQTPLNYSRNLEETGGNNSG
ncbi:MAG: hypothetical protein OEY24_00185 [Candidatus Bathyarchaeota archaeon]|nr:hypothetical protein [Candidatus Bathyarchaeota archaeon]MDH5494111.1 hypothetical protein [Candidatus Bathyarchaeota archaeon]